jgi:AhpD family alkylhydroperoxidase
MLDPNLREFQWSGPDEATLQWEAPMRVTVDPDRVREVFHELSGSSAFQESRALAEAGGLPVEMLQAMSLRPEILKAFGATGEGAYPGGILERELKEKVILKVSLQNECQFCVNSHRDIMRMIGIPEAQIEDLEAPRHLTGREALALDYTSRAIRDAKGIGEDFFDRLRQEFSDEEIVELTFLIGLIQMLNLFNNALRVTYSGDYEG